MMSNSTEMYSDKHWVKFKVTTFCSKVQSIANLLKRTLIRRYALSGEVLSNFEKSCNGMNDISFETPLKSTNIKFMVKVVFQFIFQGQKAFAEGAKPPPHWKCSKYDHHPHHHHYTRIHHQRRRHQYIHHRLYHNHDDHDHDEGALETTGCQTAHLPTMI